MIALTELWRTQDKFQTVDRNFTVSEPIKVKKPGTDELINRFPNDKAAVVGILLSEAAEQKLESFGSEGERVCWVHIN